jgi:glycosyltransferase involved in cell wall biosynthesis
MIVPPVPASELAWRIAEHDIGLALEDATIPSRNLSVSNKVFQYLQSGLAVVATPTAGQREVLDQCRVAGTVLTRATAQALAAALNRYLAEPEVLAAARQAARQDSQNLFSWEAQKTKNLRWREARLACFPCRM